MPRRPQNGANNGGVGLTIYFVQCSQSDKTDRHMVQAFMTCQSANLKPEWVKEEDVEDMQLKSTTVFVLRDFRGPIFEHLSSKQCLVCGPRCINSCVSGEVAIPPNNSPVFTVPMRGLVITTTRVPKIKKEEIKKMIGYMGGSYSDNLTMAVTHLITDEGGSTKCEEASEINIPIMKTSWVNAVWEEALTREVSATDNMFKRHALPVFHNLEITCSNLNREVKIEMKKLIESNGGVCTGKLIQNKTCVVVIGEAEGDKYKHAQIWDIPCVRPSWIYECIKRAAAVSKKDHLVKPKPTCSTPTKLIDMPSFMNSSEISVVRGAEMTRCEVNDSISSVSSCGSLRRLKPPNKAQSQDLEYKKLLDRVNLSEISAAGLFLDGCRVYLSGFTNQETEKLKKVLNSGGATILMIISDMVSHIVVGSFVSADASAISQLQPRPHVVSLEWILASVKQKSPAAVQPYLCLNNDKAPPPPSPLSHKGLELLKSNTSREEQESASRPVSRKLFVKAPKLSSLSCASSVSKPEKFEEPELKRVEEPARKEEPNRDTGNDDNNTNDNQTLSSTIDTLGPGVFFQGLVFEIIDLVEPELAMEAITNAGGAVIRERDHAVPDYAVVPFEGTTAQVSAPEVVTLLWIEDCFGLNRVVDVAYYHRPFTFKAGRYPLEGTAVCISGYVGRERTFIAHAASVLGATVQELFSRRDHPAKGILKATHLICSEPTGSKYNAAIKWAVPTVTKSWIIACATTGVRQPVEHFPVTPNGSAMTTPKPAERSSSSTGPIGPTPAGTRGSERPPPSTPTVARGPDRPTPSTPAGAMGTDHPPPSTPAVSITDNKGTRHDTDLMFAQLENAAAKVTGHQHLREAAVPRRHSDITPVPVTPKVIHDTRPRSLDRTNSLLITKRKLTPSSRSSQHSFDDGDDQDELEFEIGVKSKQRKLSVPRSNEFGTPPAVIVNKRLSTISPMMSPFHTETPESPYGQVFTPDPSPATRKKWEHYIDNLIDVDSTSVTLPKARRLSTPLSVIKKQVLAKFAGEEIEGIQAETGELLKDGPYRQWRKGSDSRISDASNLSTEHSSNCVTPVVNPENQVSSFETNDESVKKDLSVEKLNPRVLALKCNENMTPVSHTKNTKKFAKKGVVDRTKPEEETPESKLVTAQSIRINSERKSMDLMEKYRNFDAGNELTAEMRDRLANRLKPPADHDLDDVDNPLKEISGMRRDLEGSVTWDIERPQYLEKIMEKELAKKAADQARVAQQQPQLPTNNSLEKVTATLETSPEQHLQPNNSMETTQMFSKNDENDEKEDNKSDEPTKIFILSSIKQESRDKYEGIIKNLGGAVSTSAFFDPKITHIVIDKPARNEKMLCGIASGKWVLHISYLDQCYESRQFLPEDDYEWGSPRSLRRLPSLGAGSQEALLGKAAYRWRHRVSDLGPSALPFRHITAVLLTVPNKAPQLNRLLTAGGATILPPQQLLEASHCFIDAGKVELPVSMKELAKKDIHCLPPVYLAEYLMRTPTPQPHNYWIDDYKKAKASLTAF